VIVSRFAPAPTGYLHLGHVLNAIYVWGTVRARGGRVLLRIEDHDRQRSRPQFERGILEDLEWLGFEHDEGVVRQSERRAIYESALDKLRAAGLVYACGCSRAIISRGGASAGPTPEDAGAELARPYPGTCALKQLAETPGRGLRVRLAAETIQFTDLRHGAQTQQPSEQCGDLLVRDRDGNWTYQFAAVVDDHIQGVTHVIRGDDLLSSTGRQIQLARMLGRGEPPRFLHHPLIMKTAAQKLSKSDGDTGVRDLRAAGVTAAEVIGRAAFLGGLTRAFRPIEPADVSSMIGP
jgi:glutamyl-tRNA synthetase/glutamyl-Q tRNA(Asp) synthetase